MNIDLEINKICNDHKKSGLYNDSLEQTIFNFVNAYESFYIQGFQEMYEQAREGLMVQGNQEYWDRLNEFQIAFHEGIKFSFADCQPGSCNEDINLETINKYKKEIESLNGYRRIRNIIDRYKLGLFNAVEKNGNLHFYSVQGKRSFIFDVYSRNIAANIPGAKEQKDLIRELETYSLMFDVLSKPIRFESSKIFKPMDTDLKVLSEKYFGIFSMGIPDKILTYKVGSFSLKEYLKIYSFLAALGSYKTAYVIANKSKKIISPCVCYPKTRLIFDAARVCELEQFKVEAIINELIYDVNFQKDYITLFQPLFKLNEKIVFSTNVLLLSYVVEKTVKYFTLSNKNPKLNEIYGQFRSKEMNDRIETALKEKYPSLYIYRNKTLKFGKDDKAEIDICIFEKKTQTAILCELKRIQPVESDKDAFKKEIKINSYIGERLYKDGLVKEHIDKFIKDNELESEFVSYSYHSLVVINEFCGNTKVDEKIKVLDEPLFFWLLDIFNGNISEFISYVERSEFFKELEKLIPIKNKSQTFEYLDNKITVNF